MSTARLQYAPHRVIGEVEHPHTMNGQPCPGNWLLLEFDRGGKAYHCPACKVGIHDSGPVMFAELEAARLASAPVEA